MSELFDYSDIFQSEFLDGGRGEKSASGRLQLDCWGLVRLVMQRMGCPVPEIRAGALDTAAKQAAFESERASGRWERLAEPVAPCIVGMRTCAASPRAVSHFGVFVGDDQVLHIFDEAGVHLNYLRSREPRLRGLAGFWRYVG